MNELLYANQDAWKNANTTERDNIFKSYAEQLKLNIDQYKTDIASNKVKNKIDFDMALGRKHGVAATPTFYINGKNTEMDSSGSIESSVKEALKKAGVEVKDLTHFHTNQNPRSGALERDLFIVVPILSLERLHSFYCAMYVCHSAGTTSTAIFLRLDGTNLIAIGMCFALLIIMCSPTRFDLYHLISAI